MTEFVDGRYGLTRMDAGANAIARSSLISQTCRILGDEPADLIIIAVEKGQSKSAVERILPVLNGDAGEARDLGGGLL